MRRQKRLLNAQVLPVVFSSRVILKVIDVLSTRGEGVGTDVTKTNQSASIAAIESRAADGEAAHAPRTVAAWIAVAFLLRAAIACFVPLLPDEAYYWQWSRHLATGYFDHPPGIALLIATGTAVFGNTTLGVRAGPAAAALVAHVAIVRLAWRLGGNPAARRAALLVLLLPLATLGLVLATPDAPLFASVAIGLLSLERALAATVRSQHALAWWAITGVSLGMAFISKYTAVLMPAALVLACLAYAPLRQRLREAGPWLASVIALCIFLPVVAWNAQADWVSIRFQFQHGFGAPLRGTPIGRELELIGGQLGLATPIFGVLLFSAVTYAIGNEWKSRNRTQATDVGATRFAFACTALVPLVFFAVSAWRRHVEPNWPALFYPAAIVLLASNQTRWAESRWWKSGVAFAAVLLLLLVLQTWRPVLPIAAAKDPIARAHGWRSLAQAVDVARQSEFLRGTNNQWVAAERYQDASELAFYLHDQPQVFSLNLNGRPNQYDLWSGPADNVRANDALVVSFDATPAGDALAAVVGGWFLQSKRGEVVPMRRENGVIGERRIWLYRSPHNIPAQRALLPASVSRH